MDEEERMPEEDRDSERYYELNWLGTAVYLGGAAVRQVAGFLDTRIQETAGALKEAERVFYEELDPNIEDAQIIDDPDDEAS